MSNRKNNAKPALSVVPLERKDLPFIYQLMNSVKIMGFWFQEPYLSLDELALIYDKHITDQTERHLLIRQGNRNVGIVELVSINTYHSSAEIQIIIDPKSSGNGYAQNAMKYAVDYAFRLLGIHKLYSYVDIDNGAGIHVYEKLGFISEGRLQEQFFANGKYHDALFMSMLSDEYFIKPESVKS